MNIELRGQVTEREHTAAQWLNLKPSSAIAVVCALVVILTLGLLWLWFFGTPKQQMHTAGWMLLAFVAILTLNIALIQPLKWRRSFRQNKALHRPFELIITDENVVGQNDSGQSTTPWTDYLRWKEGSGVFLLYLADDLFQVVPTRIFSSTQQIEEFRALLTQRVRK